MFSKASARSRGGRAHLPGGRPPGGRPLALTSSGGHCSGQYASYWNAFLFIECFPKTNRSQFNEQILKISRNRSFPTTLTFTFSSAPASLGVIKP